MRRMSTSLAVAAAVASCAFVPGCTAKTDARLDLGASSDAAAEDVVSARDSETSGDALADGRPVNVNNGSYPAQNCQTDEDCQIRYASRQGQPEGPYDIKKLRCVEENTFPGSFYCRECTGDGDCPSDYYCSSVSEFCALIADGTGSADAGLDATPDADDVN